MKIILLSVLAIAMIGLMIPNVFAPESVYYTKVTIEPTEGSGNPSDPCVPEDPSVLSSCYSPAHAIVGVGSEVVFSNTDMMPHSFTYGTDVMAEDVGSVFDSGLLMQGQEYTWSPDTAGEFGYFCMVHPWMTGLIEVESDFPTSEPTLIMQSVWSGGINDRTEIQIFGKTSSLDYPVQLTYFAPAGNVIRIDQLDPDEGGWFDLKIDIVGPIWTKDGVYSITGKQEFNDIKVTIVFETKTTIEPTEGSGNPSDPCVPEDPSVLSSCYSPAHAIVGVGSEVVFSNTDMMPHSFTYGTDVMAEDVGSVFDSGLLMQGQEYTWSPDTAGEFGYFCMVHPWMTGLIEVESDFAEVEITLSTDKSSYQYGDTISISGNAYGNSNTNQVAITITNPSDQVIIVDQLSVVGPGGFSTSFNASGQYWEETGNYWIIATYGSLNEMERFYFTAISPPTPPVTPPPTPPVTPPPTPPVTPPTPPPPEFEIIGGTITSFTINNESNSFGIEIEATEYGTLRIFLPEHIITPFDDGLFFVLIDSVESTIGVGNIQVSTSDGTWLTIFFHPTAEKIEIIGSSTLTPPTPTPPTPPAPAPTSTPSSGNVIQNVRGSSTPGCEPNCFSPSVMRINVGETVTWDNPDTSAHTTTAGSPADGPSGAWDSSLMNPNRSFSVTFPYSGTYPYFCMVHPWMIGTVIVDGGSSSTPPTPANPIPGETATTPSSPFTTSYTPHLRNTTWYYVVDSYPSWFPDSKNVVQNGIGFWKDSIPGIKFIQIDSLRELPNSSSNFFKFEFVKEFGREHVGHAISGWYLEVGMGDSYCGGEWNPYSLHHASSIAAHEIGHILGLDHVQDKSNIMYPTALSKEYGTVTIEKTTRENMASFIPICTTESVSTIDWHVSSDDPIFGFDVYFVPSVNEFNKLVDGEEFNYYSNSGCSKTNMISVGGTCSNVSDESGLIISMDSESSQPLTELTISLRETGGNRVITSIPNQYSALSSQSEIVSTTPASSPTASTPANPIPNEPEPVPEPEHTPKPDIIPSSKYGTVNVAQEYVNILESGNVKISGQINGDVKKGDKIVLIFTKPDGTTDGQTVFPTSDGYFETFLTFDKETPLGNHEIMVISQGNVVGLQNLQVANTPEPETPAYTPPTPASTSAPTPTPPSNEGNICGDGTILKDGVCIAACGDGTIYKDGKCEIIQAPTPAQAPTPTPALAPTPTPALAPTPVETTSESKGGGCLIATAAFGSEMEPQVQFLRELRDNTVLQTHSGTSFMTGFNQFYYSFSPQIADLERENPVFKEAVKLTLTPLLTSLTLLNYVDIDTEQEMLGYGIGVILLNIGMYFVVPAAVIIALKNRIKVQK